MIEEQQEKKWWEIDDKENIEEKTPTIEESIQQLEKITKKSISQSYRFKQLLPLIYVVVNIVFMYVSVDSPSAIYIGLYMIPLIILLLDYFLMIGKIARSE